MANPTCTRALLTTAIGNGQNALNRHQWEAAMIWLRVLELAAIGGTDYRLTLNTTLIDDAVQLAKTMDRFERRLARINIQRNAAIAAGSTDTSLTGGVSGLNEATKCCFQSFPDFEAINILLLCKLGVHKAYPQ